MRKSQTIIVAACLLAIAASVVLVFLRQQHLHSERIAALSARVSASQSELDSYSQGYDAIYRSGTSCTEAVNEFAHKLSAVDDEASLAVALDRLTKLEKAKISNDATLNHVLTSNFEPRDGPHYFQDTHEFFAAASDLQDQIIGLEAVLRNGEANPNIFSGVTYQTGRRAGAAMRKYVDENAAVLRTYSSFSNGSVANVLRLEASRARHAYDAAGAEPLSQWIVHP